MKFVSLPKFVIRKASYRSAYSSATRIYAVIGHELIEDTSRLYFLLQDVLEGNLVRMEASDIKVCHYDDERVFGTGGSYIYYDNTSLRANRSDGPAAVLGDKTYYCYKGALYTEPEKFFESLTKEERKKAAFNLDEF